MTDLAGHVEDYLRLRRALGFKLQRPGEILPQFVAYLGAAGAPAITCELAIAWAQLPQGVQRLEWAHRLSAVRGFATYMKTIDPATEIPPPDVFGARQRRPVPYLYSEADIRRLLQAARQLQPPLRAATHETLFGFLAVTGLRIGEAIGLHRHDVDLGQGVITIEQAKFGRARLVPLHSSTTDALKAYSARRDQLCPTPESPTFFVSSLGTALLASPVRRVFHQLTADIGLRSATVRPRIHDLRHSFAVRTLVQWHRSGIDVDSRMAVLSTYLGHVNPSGTYWYLSAAPELMELAAARLDSRFGARP